MLTARKLWAEKCVGQDRRFQPMLTESGCKTKNQICITYRFLLIIFKLQIFNRSSLLLADFSRKSVTRLLANSRSFCDTI